MARVKVRKTKFTIPSKYLLLIMTILCIALMLLTFTTDVVTGPLEAVSGYVIIPFQDGISEVGMFLTSRKDNIKKMNELMEENTSLQEQVDSLSIENSMLQQDKYELSRLRELYLLDEQYSDYEKIGARVIGMDPGNWFSVFLINKGTNDGISVAKAKKAGIKVIAYDRPIKYADSDLYISFDNEAVGRIMGEVLCSKLPAGSTIIYSYLQAIGVINDHVLSCDFRGCK